MKKKEKPCFGHKLALPSRIIPEAKNLTLKKCNLCGWWIKRKAPKKGILAYYMNKAKSKLPRYTYINGKPSIESK